jgi:hypothetical protein
VDAKITARPIPRQHRLLLRLRRTSFVVLLVGLWLNCFAADSDSVAETAVNYSAITLIGSIRKSKDSFEVVVRCVPFNTNSVGGGKTRFLGTDGEQPTCIAQISIKLNGMPMILPRDRYSDLANIDLPRGVYVTIRGKSVVLHVNGGDAAGAYKVRFFFDAKRRVSAREVEQVNEDGDTIVTHQKF